MYIDPLNVGFLTLCGFAALAFIRKANSARQTESDKIYVIAHCAGSLALSCGLLDGTIPGEWLGSAK